MKTMTKENKKKREKEKDSKKNQKNKMSQEDKKKSLEEWNTTLTKMNQGLKQAWAFWKRKTQTIKAAKIIKFKKFKDNIKITNEKELG